MRIISHRKIREFYERHPDSELALERWYDMVQKADWRCLGDVKVDFPSVDYVRPQRYIFNIKGNQYRLVVVILFTIGRVYVRFVGTHEEYDKIDCSTI